MEDIILHADMCVPRNTINQQSRLLFNIDQQQKSHMQQEQHHQPLALIEALHASSSFPRTVTLMVAVSVRDTVKVMVKRNRGDITNTCAGPATTTKADGQIGFTYVVLGLVTRRQEDNLGCLLGTSTGSSSGKVCFLMTLA